MGNPPAKLVQQIHSSSDTKVMSMITTVEEAVNVVRNGVDIVVAQGAEAGGHRSTFNIVVDDSSNEELPVIGTMTLVPQVVDALKKMEENEERKQEDKIDNKKSTPVIAAGGISDGRGLVAALALGADGVIFRAFTGRPARGLRNRFIEEYNKSDPQPLAWPFQALAADDIYATAQKQNNADYFPLFSWTRSRPTKGKEAERRRDNTRISTRSQ